MGLRVGYSEIRRKIKEAVVYRLSRPKPPRHPTPLAGPVLVVGSAPVSNLPKGFDESFSVLTVNGSQSVAKKWGISKPDATFLQFNQIEGTNDNAVAVRRVLNGEETGILHVIRWPFEEQRLRDGLSAFNYRCDELRLVDQYHRMALYEAIIGKRHSELDNARKFSNGVTAVLYALLSGAPAVIISGINPGSSGHVYNDLGLQRLHSDMDRAVLLTLHARGAGIFTADPEVAASTGLPLWQGRI
ncbi:membrane-anchored protein [Pseudaminobacter soli (ex Li et al. 2025)]|uniref:Membrane-anchored protein n=1 Tax=Pseudaminobacter soli (ex Li et al. 2025) TaxID=1295366 RepID=A0A2P7SB37_9HYPH|nr:membrane-anchored protein [Mesorhizobium soli]PSJ59680.1 membrane-anchored protein [Mesorhizobium soli]